MGRNHVRVLSRLPQARMVGLLDIDPAAAGRVSEEFSVPILSDLDEVIEKAEAAVVAVPTVRHADLGCTLLEHGLHLLVEKPLAASLAEADRLLEAAAAADRVLAVGHVEFHNPAVQQLLGVTDAPSFVEVQRLAQFTPRSLDVDVILDLMIHDLQILHALDPSPVQEVRAAGINVLSDHYDIVNARVALESGCVANITASRVSSERVRKLRVFLTRRYYSLDYHQQEIKGLRLEAAEGRPVIHPEQLAVQRGEPLVAEVAAFIAACRGDRSHIVTGTEGRRALATALAVVDAIPA